MCSQSSFKFGTDLEDIINFAEVKINMSQREAKLSFWQGPRRHLFKRISLEIKMGLILKYQMYALLTVPFHI